MFEPQPWPMPFQVYYFIKFSQQLCKIGVAPILQVRKLWRRLSDLVRRKIQVFQCPCFSTPRIVLFRSHCGFLLCQKFLLSEKTEKTSMECLKSEIINLIHHLKKDLGWQADRKQRDMKAGAVHLGILNLKSTITHWDSEQDP